MGPGTTSKFIAEELQSLNQPSIHLFRAAMDRDKLANGIDDLH